GWRKYQNYYKDANEDQTSGINMKIIRYADVLLMMAEAELYRPGGSVATAIGYINEVRSRPSVSLSSLSTGLTETQAFNALVHERKVELAGEQHRFPDIIRWGIAGTELAGTNFRTGTHEVFPIPDAEIVSNASIGPEDQN